MLNFPGWIKSFKKITSLSIFRADKTKFPHLVPDVKSPQRKMAPWMATSVFRCAAIFLVLLVNLVFCRIIRSPFTREELIGKTTPVDLFPNFLIPSVEILDILVKGALTFVHAVRRRRRGRRAGALRYREYSSLTSDHCATNWTSYSYW